MRPSYRLLQTDLQPRMDGYSLAVRSASTAMKLMIYPKQKPHRIRSVTVEGEANMISGRGIGMDAVRLLVEESGGTITLILDEEGKALQAFHQRAHWPLDTLMMRVA